MFEKQEPQDGRLSEEKARNWLKQLELPDSSLDKIWELSDQDKDGYLDRYEFTVAWQLTARASYGDEIPDKVHICISSLSCLHVNTLHYSFLLNCPERTFPSLSQKYLSSVVFPRLYAG